MIDAPHRTTRSRIIKIVFLNIFFFILISYLIADAAHGLNLIAGIL